MHNLMTVMLTAWGYKLTYLEFFAFITSVIGVWYGIYGPRITWPWWNISSLLYALLFFQQKYYASAALQFVFIAGGFWGWFGWGPKGAKPHKLNWKINLAMVGIYFIAWFALNPLLTHIGAAATWTDSFGFVGSCIAQGLMCMEKFEAWPVWFVVDAVYTFQFWHGGSYLTSVLYFIFVLLAIGGWKRWNRVSNLNKIAMK